MGFFDSATGAPKLKPNVLPSSVFFESATPAPKLKPLLVLLVDVAGFGAPNEKPSEGCAVVVKDDGAGEGEGAALEGVVPKLKGLAPIAGAPKLNPPTPTEESDVDDTLVSLFSLAFDACPGRAVSHAAHLVTSPVFLTLQISHFQESFFTSKAFPQLLVPPEGTAAELGIDSDREALASAPPSSSSLDSSSSLKPSPNNHSIYHDMKSSLYIESSGWRSFLRVRRCSSSQ